MDTPMNYPLDRDTFERARRAYAARCTREGHLYQQPANTSFSTRCDGREYVVLENGNGPLAVYLVRPSDRSLRWLKEWPDVVTETNEDVPEGSDDDFETDHLTGRAREVADAIVAHLAAELGRPPVQGSRAFRTIEEWADLGHVSFEHGRNVPVVDPSTDLFVLHAEGGDLQSFLDDSHLDRPERRERFRRLVKRLGLHPIESPWSVVRGPPVLTINIDPDRTGPLSSDEIQEIHRATEAVRSLLLEDWPEGGLATLDDAGLKAMRAARRQANRISGLIARRVRNAKKR